MELRIIGNDIEFDRQKIARIFDILPTMRWELEKAFDRANEYEAEIERLEIQLRNLKEEAYRDGYSDGQKENNSGYCGENQEVRAT